ncbi:MAG: SurA N-terminal domain-containing protein [Gammaproteobacteria bacterium]|nr:MAG: SurA N-terminal domain-containing protein [Gammaproteobacteria bacterium]
MLQKIREKITGWVAGVILALLAFVFAVWGIDIGFSNQSVAAVVNGDKLPIAPVRQAIQNQMSQLQQAYGTEVPEVLELQVRDSVIEGFVRNRLLVQRIREEGYRVSDEAVSEGIRQMPVFQVNGQFSMDAYRAMLANVGYSPTSFEAEQRQSLQIAQLQDGILNSAFVTPGELEQRVRIADERRELAWLTVPIANFLDSIEITDDAVAEEYETNIDRYMNPESVDVSYLEVNLAEIASAISVTEQGLRDFYDAEVVRDPEMFSTPEQRRTRHILVAIDDDRDEESARERARSLLDRVRGGEEFSKVASEASDDTGSASLGGDLDWVEPGMMDAPFEEALFAMDEGDISEPVRTAFGYHIILLEKIRPGDVREYDEARADLETEYRNRKAEDIFYERAERMSELTFENPDTLRPAAEELGLQIGVIEKMTRSGDTGLAANAEVLSAAFSAEVLENGENSQPLEIDEGRAVVLRVDQHHEPQPRPLADVSEEIRGRLQREAARSRVLESGEQALGLIEAGEDLESVAGQVSAEFSPSLRAGRDDAAVPVRIREAVFAAELDGDLESGGVVLADGSYAVWVLTDIVPGDVNALSTVNQRELRTRLAGASGGAELTGYINQLRNKASVVVNTEQFE